MKISKAKLRQIIKEELGALREQDPAEENYVKLVNTLGDIFQHHLEEVGMERAEILRAVEEAAEIELAGNDEEAPLPFTRRGNQMTDADFRDLVAQLKE